MSTVVRWSDALFGRGDDGYPFWLLTVRINILVFVLCAAVVVVWRLSPARVHKSPTARTEVFTVLALTLLAGLLRFGVVASNLADLGGIGYSRILLGYSGHFGAAQLYSLVYARGGRDLEHAIFLNRLASTLTIPLLYALCRRLAPSNRAFAPLATLLVVLHPLPLLFCATDGLPISTSLIAAAAYLFLVMSITDAAAPPWARLLTAMAAATGLSLLTQVRYENLLLLGPAAVYVFAERRRLARQHVLAAIALLSFAAVYSIEVGRAGLSFQNPVIFKEVLPAVEREVFGNPIFGMVPLLVGTGAALLMRRSRVRWFAPVPLIATLPLLLLSGTPGHNIARTFVNQLALLAVVAGYGLALLWETRWRLARVAVIGCLLWAAALPLLFWSNLHEQHLEIAEHDFLRAAFATLPSGIDRIIVPDDEVLLRGSQSTIELMNKYRMIAYGAGAQAIDLVGMTRFLERPDDVDCGHGNCLLFRGLPCLGIRHYWFSQTECDELMASRAGSPLREQEIEAGSFLDCSIYRGAARQEICEPTRKLQRFGLYRLKMPG